MELTLSDGGKPCSTWVPQEIIELLLQWTMATKDADLEYAESVTRDLTSLASVCRLFYFVVRSWRFSKWAYGRAGLVPRWEITVAPQKFYGGSAPWDRCISMGFGYASWAANVVSNGAPSIQWHQDRECYSLTYYRTKAYSSRVPAQVLTMNRDGNQFGLYRRFKKGNRASWTLASTHPNAGKARSRFWSSTSLAREVFPSWRDGLLKEFYHSATNTFPFLRFPQK